MSPLGDVYKAALPAGLKMEDGYKPRCELFVTLAPQFRSDKALHLALSMLHRAQKQLMAFTTFLSLSHWDSLEGSTTTESITEVTRDELLNESHCTLTVIKALADRGFLTTYEKEVGRIGNDSDLSTVKPHELSAPQAKAYEELKQEMEHKCDASARCHIKRKD